MRRKCAQPPWGVPPMPELDEISIKSVAPAGADCEPLGLGLPTTQRRRHCYFSRWFGRIWRASCVSSKSCFCVVSDPLSPSQRHKWRICRLLPSEPSYWRQVRASAAGIAIPNVNASKLEGFDFPLAPSREQERIVAKAGRAAVAGGREAGCPNSR